MKYVKRTLLIVLILAALLIGLAFILINFYKKELTTLFTEHLKSQYALTLTVKDVDVTLFSNFPSASIKLNDVYVNSEEHAGKDPLLTASSIALSLNLKKLFRKEFEITAVSINSANINLIINADGSKNFKFEDKIDTLIKVASTPTTVSFDIHQITIVNSQFNFIDKEKTQHINIGFADNIIELEKQAEGFEFDFTGNLKIGGLTFKERKGAFLKNSIAEVNLKGTWFQSNNSIFIREKSTVEIEKQFYDVSSFIQYGKEKQLILNIIAKNAEYDKAVRLLNSKLKKALANFSVNKPLDATVLVVAALGIKQDPIVVVRINSSENDVNVGNSKVHYTEIAFKGMILSLDSSYTKGNEEEARIIFSPIKGRVLDVPFIASVKAFNFTDPFVDISASLYINGSNVKLRASDEFELKGDCIAQISYSGSVEKLNEEQFLNAEMKLRASLTFKNFSYKEHGKPFVFTVNGRADLTNTELNFNKLQLKTVGGNVMLAGKVDDFAKYALGLTNTLKLNLAASTDEFSLNPFLSKQTQKKDSTSANAIESKKAVKKLNHESNFEFNVSLKAKKLLVRKVIAEDASIDLYYFKNLLNVKALSVNTCDGKLTATATLDKMETLHADVKVDNINVTQLFEQFENFGQKAIVSDQLKGKISLNARFNGKFDNKMEIDPSSMDGTVTLKLKDGHLINYEPLLNISNFIFHNRDFNDVTFSEINETFSLKGYKMEIEELEIASNILNLFVSGTYNFKNESNVNLLIPWSNLRSRGKNYIPKLSGKSAEDVRGLKLNYSGMPKKMKLSLGHK